MLELQGLRTVFIKVSDSGLLQILKGKQLNIAVPLSLGCCDMLTRVVSCLRTLIEGSSHNVVQLFPQGLGLLFDGSCPRVRLLLVLAV